MILDIADILINKETYNIVMYCTSFVLLMCGLIAILIIIMIINIEKK